MNIRAAADIAAKERQVVVKWIKRCLREVTKAAHELPVDYPTARNDITVTIKGAGHRSSACAKGITIDIVPFRKQQTHILEYPAFAADKVIGSRANVPAEIALAATVAHESLDQNAWFHGCWSRKPKRSTSGSMILKSGETSTMKDAIKTSFAEEKE